MNVTNVNVKFVRMAEAVKLKQFKPQNTRKVSRFVNKTEHTIQKRPPQKVDSRDFVIYVGSKSNIKALLNKCDKLIKNGEQEIMIYCMGAAIQRGILLALQVCEQHTTFKHSVNTSTVALIDDLEPASDEADYEILRRNNSALQIRIFKACT